jgi:hypothetical protein
MINIIIKSMAEVSPFCKVNVNITCKNAFTTYKSIVKTPLLIKLDKGKGKVYPRPQRPREGADI